MSDEHHSHTTDQEFRALVRNWANMLNEALKRDIFEESRLTIYHIMEGMFEFSK